MTLRTTQGVARLSRATVAGAVVAAGLTVAACGGSTPVTILNTEKVERSIEQSIKLQRDKTTHVSCPSGVHQKKGLVFTCTAKFKGDSTPFVVTQQDGAGRVHYIAR